MSGSTSSERYSIRGHGAKYERKKEAAIAALLSARTDQEAATEAGISRRTLSRWKRLPEFRAQLHASKQQLLNSAHARYLTAGSAAVSTVLKIMVDPGAPASVRLRAASQVHAAAEKTVEKEARSMHAARAARHKRRVEAEERSCSAERQILNLMGSDGALYLALVKQVYAEAVLTTSEHEDLMRCNDRFIQIWRRLDIGIRYLRPNMVSFRISDTTDE